MKLSSMPTLKRSLTIVMGNESPSYKNRPLLFDINLVLRTRQQCFLFFLLWLYMSWGFDLLKWNYNSCKNFSIIHDALVVGNVGAYLDFSLHDMDTSSKGPTFSYLTHHFEKVVNRSLGDLLRCSVGEHVTNWDQVLPMVLFAYNRLVNGSIGRNRFEIVTGLLLRKLIDLVPLLIETLPSVEADAFKNMGISNIFNIEELTLCSNPKDVTTNGDPNVHLPPTPRLKEEIEDVIDHQIVSTKG
ncbi:hypothetical protein CK203_089426 [Vitis vinifera]|uniref:Uncharacterized protein n=1 Tax=Vitis vinifera TaxID=29760 RepID=A0A438E8R4_VITVI|nr:hypothetical protein CK203_089426 [Vitis vinifera]